MNRTIYLGVFLVSALLLVVGVLFLCAATSVPARLPLAIILLSLGALGAGASGLAYRRWLNVQPAALASRVTDLAAAHDAEISLSQVMAAYDVPAAAASATLDELVRSGQARPEPRAGGTIWIFPGLMERKAVRKCVYCGNTYPVRQPLEKCPNCGGPLEIVKQ